jgi:hypothetical protein
MSTLRGIHVKGILLNVVQVGGENDPRNHTKYTKSVFVVVHVILWIVLNRCRL